MRRLVAAALLLLLATAVVPVQLQAHGAGSPKVFASSVYTINRYGYAVVNVTVTFVNNSTGDLVPPTVDIGLGNLSGKAVASTFSGSSFTVVNNLSLGGPPVGGPFTVSGNSLSAGANASFTISTLLNGVVSTAKNGSLEVLTLSGPSISIPVDRLREHVVMPPSTILVSAPSGLSGPASATSGIYAKNLTSLASPAAVSSVRAVKASTLQDFNPLDVYRASRTIGVGTGGVPTVTDSLSFRNMGTADMSTLYITPLVPANSKVTILPSVEPRLISSVTTTLTGFSINLPSSTGFPVSAGSNYTITYRYNLPAKYYSVSGGQVTVNIPESSPIPAFVNSYTLSVSVPSGVTVVQGGPQPMSNVSPWQKGSATLSYQLAVGWAIDSGIPAASLVFVLLLIGLFASKSQMGEEEEKEEETSTDRASDMIKAFDDKTTLINGFWSEIESKDPNELGKSYFDELRSRLDSFRGKSLQRLNEVKQKSSTQRFFDLLNQIQNTEREVDRAAKDKLNLYEQFYMKRMRKEVYDRLLPQYSKRLEKALNQLTDELHVVQREAKLL